VVQPCEKMAEMVFHVLLSRIANPSLPPRESYLPFKLLITESTTKKSKALRKQRAKKK